MTATGWVYVGGDHIVRRDLKALLEAHGATFHEEFQGSTDLVIQGELRDHQIQDDRVGGVDALDQLWQTRADGYYHVHLIRTDDLVDLLAGERVACRVLPRDWLKFKKKKRASIRRGQQGT